MEPIGIRQNNPLHGSADRSPSGDKNIPLGLRNCNPLNIRVGKSAWKGQISPETSADSPAGAPGFVRFSDFAFGFRAALVLLRNYITLHQRNTIAEIISRWAPPYREVLRKPSECSHSQLGDAKTGNTTKVVLNNTSAYTDYVALATGIPADRTITTNPVVLAHIAGAMAVMECGHKVWTSEERRREAARALDMFNRELGQPDISDGMFIAYMNYLKNL